MIQTSDISGMFWRDGALRFKLNDGTSVPYTRWCGAVPNGFGQVSPGFASMQRALSLGIKYVDPTER